jgi:hypothetical protein
MSLASWFQTHTALAHWVVAISAVGMLVSLAWAAMELRRRRCERTASRLKAAHHPVRALGDCARMLRDLVEREDGVARLAQTVWLQDGTLGQRIKDVRAIRIDELPSARAIEAAYEAREAATRLVVWLERLGRNPAESRIRIQTIWKTLHDASGGLQRDVAANDAMAFRLPGQRRRSRAGSPSASVKAG